MRVLTAKHGALGDRSKTKKKKKIALFLQTFNFERTDEKNNFNCEQNV